MVFAVERDTAIPRSSFDPPVFRHMLYHIWHPTTYFTLWWFFWPIWLFFCKSNELLIKDPSGQTVYRTVEESIRYTAPKRYLYRDSGDRIATIECFSGEACLIKLHRTGEYIPIRSEGYYKQECFEYAGEKLCWNGINKLMDEKGITIAKLKTPFFGWTNVGELNIVETTRDNHEIVMITLAAMHWRMQLAYAKAAEDSRCRHAENEANRRKGQKAKELEENRLKMPE